MNAVLPGGETVIARESEVDQAADLKIIA